MREFYNIMTNSFLISIPLEADWIGSCKADSSSGTEEAGFSRSFSSESARMLALEGLLRADKGRADLVVESAHVGKDEFGDNS